MFVSANVPLNLLENKHFRNILEYTLNGRYNVPNVDHMNETLIHKMFKGTKADVNKLLNNVRHFTLFVDAWSISTNVCYITLRAHVFDPNLHVQSYVLDTSEILETYTIHHLLTHIENILTRYEISDLKDDNVTVIFNSTSYTDIHEKDETII